MSGYDDPRSLKSGRRFLILAALGLIGLVAWAAWAEIEQIARARGQVIASGRTHLIQSAIDGVIASMSVREGDRVEGGRELFQLDRSQAEAAFRDSEARVAALKATLARLRAEVFGSALVFPDEVKAFPAFVANQTALFQRRRAALEAEVAVLQDSLQLVEKELEITEPLLASGDIGQAEVIRLKRQAAELRGQITNRRNRYFQDAQADMTKAEEELATQEQLLAERSTTLARTLVQAPAGGIVKNIQITTPGAKVRPGDIVMELLPTEGELIFEARLNPADLAFIRVGQPASVKLDAYDFSIYGGLAGVVHYISPDALTEKTITGDQAYYRVQVRIDPASLAERNRRRPERLIEVQPGMTGSVDIITGRQTVLAYLTKPVTKTLSEAMRER